MELSKEGHDIVFKMVQQLVMTKYCYRQGVVGCYRGIVQIQGLPEPPEGEDKIVDMVIEYMGNM